jgi:hypothetical protein
MVNRCQSNLRALHKTENHAPAAGNHRPSSSHSRLLEVTTELRRTAIAMIRIAAAIVVCVVSQQGLIAHARSPLSRNMIYRLPAGIDFHQNDTFFLP